MDRELVMAAGGIVWRNTEAGRKVAVVHRRRYAGEVALPKGKLQAGESLRDAALREVREETGCEAKIIDYSGCTCYTYDGVEKLVVFWHMEALGASGRMTLLGLEEQAELLVVVTVLRAETDKLSGWRQKAARDLLSPANKPGEAVKAGTVFQAALVRDEHYDNQFYKDGLLRTQILWLVLILVAVMAGLFLLAILNAAALTRYGTSLKLIGAVTLFGFLGGTVSAMMRSVDPTQSARIPEMTTAGRVTFMRILMGGASAVVVYCFLKSQLTGVFSVGIENAMKGMNAFTACGIAFCAGFSERLVVRAVEYVAGKDPDRGKDRPK